MMNVLSVCVHVCANKSAKNNRTYGCTRCTKNYRKMDRVDWPASVALLVASQYALPGYGDRQVWVRGPG